MAQKTLFDLKFKKIDARSSIGQAEISLQRSRDHFEIVKRIQARKEVDQEKRARVMKAYDDAKKRKADDIEAALVNRNPIVVVRELIDAVTIWHRGTYCRC